ncbi:MAG: bifunctional glycosyltransferase family 2/GtrA family protein [Lentisphaeria bacterium]|nr:bifunctional glycosyltransferase family 2/GtrA family protein [Lentisphaeria bacterium]
MNKAVIVIPALNPPPELSALIKNLCRLDPERKIIMYNDGSSESFTAIFEEIRQTFSQVIFLRHEINMGKGKTLKDAMSYVMQHFPHSGIVTADSDGQHAAEDILAVAAQLENSGADLVLGVRDFSAPDIPPRSKFGNDMTCFIFRYLIGMNISDTQTGLRGISAKIMPALLQLQGDRYEFETEMLLEVHKQNFVLVQHPISTIYLNENSESHFNPMVDSILIYKRLFKCIFMRFFSFICSSVLSALIDLGIYSLLFFVVLAGMPGKLWWSVVIARIISSSCNYLINRNIVFAEKNKKYLADTRSSVKYFTLVAVVMVLSYSITKLGIFLLNKVSPFYIKLTVDVLLFLFCFIMQNTIVFKRKEPISKLIPKEIEKSALMRSKR